MDDWLYGGQSAARAYQHGMRDGTTDETVELAAARAQVFIDNSIEYAVTAQLDFEAQGGTGYSDHALTAFGEALHTVQDETSPQHAGFQQWFGLDGPTAWAKAKAHAHEENIAARSKALSDVIARAEAQQATLDLWAKFQKELDSERERRKEELQKQGSQPSPNSGNQ